MGIVRTACTYDCPDACGLLVDTGGLTPKIGGDPEHPITRGTVCYRIRKHVARLQAPDRLRSPRLRTDGGWKEIGWDEALELAAEKLAAALDEHGPPSVVFVGGGGSLGLSKELMRHFFCSLGPVTTVSGGLCGEAGEAAQEADFGVAACHDYTDLGHAGAVVLWGKNFVETGAHLLPFVREARERGAPVVLVEPRRSETAGQADRVVTVAPGGDGLLALAVLRLLADRGQLRDAHRAENVEAFEAALRRLDAGALARAAGAAISDVEHLAELYAREEPTATLVGWGLQRHARGGANLRCIDALGLLSGNIGRPGAGVSYTSWRRRGLRGDLLLGPSGRTVRAAFFGQDLAALSDPPARFVYVAGANPVTQSPDSAAVARALTGAGFTVVADAFFTDTAEVADLVLPAALMLEEDDVVGSYQHHHVARVREALAAPEGVRQDVEILEELGRRAGLDPLPLPADPAGTLARITEGWGLGPEGWALNPAHDPVPYAERFDTPSGKARLITELDDLLEEVTAERAECAEEFPLVFVSTSSRRWQTSQLPEQEQDGPARCTVHPDAAAAAGVADGDVCRLESPLGAMEVRVTTEARMHPSACVVHRGGWLRHGRCVNLLVQARETDLGGGAAFYAQRVRLAGGAGG